MDVILFYALEGVMCSEISLTEMITEMDVIDPTLA